MFSSHCCTIRRILSQKIFQQLCHLWEQFRDEDEKNIILIDETLLKHYIDALQEDFKIDTPNDKNRFLLMFNGEFEVFLGGVALNEGSFYQITILFKTESVALLLERLMANLKSESVLKNKIKKIQEVKTSNPSDLQTKFLLKLLNFLESADSGNFNYNLVTSAQEIKDLTNQQIRRKNILQQVADQIQNNLDELTIIGQTLEKVQSLLDVDRLLIYQVNVPITCTLDELEVERRVDLVTYEVLRNQDIPSILYFQDETCFSKIHHCRQKYLDGFQCVIENIDNNSLMSPCLKKLMKELNIKAKMVVPILVDHNLWGFIIAHHCFNPRHWQKTEVNYLVQIAEYFSLAITQSQSYKKLEVQKQKLEKKINQHNQELAYALVAAEVANQSKKQFLGAISHELLTPLTCVIGLSGTLIHWSANKNNAYLSIEKQQEYLQKIHDNGQKLMHLINDLLDLSQVEAGKTLLNLQFFSLNHLCAYIFHQLQTEAKYHDIQLKLDFQVTPDLDNFFADQNRLQQILFHLLDNGIKFTPSGGMVIFRVWRENQYVIFQIEDNGIGISDSQLPLLFNKFQQLEQTRTRTHSGTGLGLALVKQLVQLHQGIIEVESSVGNGSIFTVRIPQNLNPTTQHQGLLTAPTLKNKDSQNRKCSIVIISDDEENTTLICELLTSANYQVIWLMDGSTILDSITLLEPSVIIIDESIADFHDLAFDLKYIQSKRNYDFISIAIANSVLTKTALENYPFEKCFAKPISPAEFIEEIKFVTSREGKE
jgi:two-component system, sensor histidine kinase and response regulator